VVEDAVRVTVTKAEQDWRVSVNDRLYSCFPNESAAQSAADRLATVLRSCEVPVRCFSPDCIDAKARPSAA
jgi:hypothetical protein